MTESPTRTAGNSSADVTRIPVALAGRSYDVLVGHGLLDRAGEWIAPALNRPQTVIVTDETVAGLHLETLTASLTRDGINTTAIVLKPGEASKSFQTLEQLLDRLLELGVERKDHIIALGGGVIGDLVGFAAAILRRGVRFIQCPTTLLAQVDSSVGGKTAINVPRGKNLIGAFHQPSLVLADLHTLGTLDPRERRAGYAEVLKYGVIDDLTFYDWLIDHGPDVLSLEHGAVHHAVSTSVAAKARIVAADEFESGQRALLNLGHTFGHAIEAALGYDGRILHGEAVALGLVIAADLSGALGMTHPALREDLRAHVTRLGLTASLGALNRQLGTRIDSDELIRHMAQDKKMDGGTLTFILGPIGASRTVRDVDMEQVRRTLEDSFADGAS